MEAGKKSNFVLLQPCQWRMNSDPQVQQHNFIFRCTIIQFQQTPPWPARHLTECNSLLTLTSQNAKKKKWAAEPQRKKSNLVLRIKMGRVLGLTFLLSSISCSNMALNTGERAESSHMGGKLAQQQRHLRNQQHWMLPQLLPHKHFQLLQQRTSSSVQHLLRDGCCLNWYRCTLKFTAHLMC